MPSLRISATCLSTQGAEGSFCPHQALTLVAPASRYPSMLLASSDAVPAGSRRPPSYPRDQQSDPTGTYAENKSPALTSASQTIAPPMEKSAIARRGRSTRQRNVVSEWDTILRSISSAFETAPMAPSAVVASE